MRRTTLLAAAILLILGGACWASTTDIIPNFPSPYPFTEFSDTDTVALWLFDEANYKNTTLTDASPYEMSDLVLINQPTNTSPVYRGSLAAGKWGNCLNVPGSSTGFSVSYAEFKGSVCKDHLDDQDGVTSGLWGPTESPAALLYGLDSGVCTVEFWINLTSMPSTDVAVLQIGFAYSPGWTLDLKSSGTVFEINNAYTGKKAVCSTSLSTGTWIHVAFTQDGSTFRHFINGVERPTPTVSNITEQALPALQVPVQRDHDHRDFGLMNSDTRRQNRFNISVGHKREGNATMMNAKFDEVRISKVVRYSGNFTAPGSFSRAYGANPPPAATRTGPALLFAPTSTPVQLGGSKYMFIDQAIVDTSSNVTITCNPPTNGQDLSYQPAFSFERPSYFDVDGVTYMMNPYSYGDHVGITRVMTSNDGINWTFPNCQTWGGNNMVMYGNPMYSESFVDTNPNISSQEKYKLTGASSNRGIYMYFSPDGINWRRNEVAMLPVMVESGAETFFDDQNGTYYNVLKRDSSYNKTGCTGTGRRGVVFKASEYFKVWPFTVQSPPYWEGWSIPCLTCEGPVIFPANGNGEVYRARAFKYPWAPDVYLTFIWRFTTTYRQVDLGVSRDGTNWTYFATNWYMGKGSYGEALSSYGLVRRDADHQYNVTDQDEIWQYFEFGGYHDGDPRTYKRYIQRLDGFVSLNAGGTSATVVTKPLVFHGSQLVLNVKATGTLKVALLDSSQQEISGYGLANCDTITTDSVAKVVTWGGNSDVSSLAGTVVRVKFVMTNTKLYAMQFVSSTADDLTLPSPNPTTWANVPAAISPFSISMKATPATDTNGVQYYFACTAGGGHDSGWQSGATYVDTGLQPLTQYTYTVKSRDKSFNLNETAVSGPASATTPIVSVAPSVVHWKFNEGSGTAASDATGNGNTGTLYNSPTWITGKFGNALSFDGVNDYVYLNNLSTPVSGDASISLWLNYTGANTGLRALNLGGWQVRFSGGCVGWDNSGGPSAETHSTNAYNDGQWHHVVFTRTGTNYKMYIDTMADKTGTGSALSYTSLCVGAADAGTNFYIGKIDDVRIYDYALTQSEINTLYLPYDFNGDGEINIGDLSMLVSSWLQDNPSIDIAPEPDGDGIVDLLDFSVLSEHWSENWIN